MTIRNIGLLFETEDDADQVGGNLDFLRHWREPRELQAIQEAIQHAGFEPVMIGSPKKLLQHLRDYRGRIDFIFNLSVGFRSRFRLALGPALYQLADLPYSGADPYTKLVSQNKHLMKAFMDQLGIPTPKWVYLDRLAVLDRVSWPEFPLMVKPAHEGTSVGIRPDSVVHDEGELHDRLGWIFEELRMPALVERFILGREIKVGYIGNLSKRFRGALEDVDADGSPLADRFLHVRAKSEGWYPKARLEISQRAFSRLLNDCDRLYDRFLPLDYGTFDLRMDGGGQHYFLEFNADATLHPEKTLARCCELNGVSYFSMIRMILETAIERWEQK